MIKNHPLRSSDFSIGIFSSNADGGLAITQVEERWRAQWRDCLTSAQIADRAGLDFILPIARWRGFGGETHAREWSFETFTWAAGLAASTERIALFATVHVPIVHPIYAAKALATLDHISAGRAGLNIVCGWNPDEFGMFGIAVEGDLYERAGEWLEIVERAYASPEPFSFDGKYYQLKNAVSRPASLQLPRPVVMNAGFSPAGRAFAAERCDYLFTTFSDLDDCGRHAADMKDRAAKTGRDVSLYTVCHVVCRESQQEAEDYYRHYALDEADDGAVAYHMAKKQEFANSHDDVAFVRYKQRFAGGAGTYPLVGTPGHVAEEIARIANAGYTGAALSFVNYSYELPFFCDRVLPLLEKMGLRNGAAA
jgi:alkanesulfonate monooxygenase SsuD/methylene tetrahydromethanopterin reductase-like flavin-dependent oxidoreductase (luciferase family)